MMTVEEAAQALHGEWRGQDALHRRGTDSRTVGCGDLSR
jgi:UDP-N-acetylmuramoyl-tripeptide--D-alanyl-D-alanine ligase